MTDGVDFVSLFSGGGLLDLGLERAGWRGVYQCEYDRHAQAVLRRHWPNVPKHGDVRTLRGDMLPGAALWAFGSPCKGFSIANNATRNGLDHEESQLANEVTRLLSERPEADRPPLLLWENVPQVFECCKDAPGVARWLAGLRGLGYSHGRALVLTGFDAGVPQVRRRALTVFSRLLPVPEPTFTWDLDVPPLSSLLEEQAGGWLSLEQRTKLFARCESRWLKKVSERGEAEARRVVEQYRGVLLGEPREVCTFTRVWSRNPSWQRAHALVTSNDAYVAVPGMGVRRLTPVERERLMGLPEGWTAEGIYEDGSVREVCKTARARITGNGVIVGVGELVGRAALEALRGPL